MSKRRVMFVDDEVRILDALRNRLRRQRHSWDMTFVDSGRAALEHLAGNEVDVIVSDMRMPQMDGATLLARVQAEHPSVVRIVLSGHSETEASLRAANVAHQFLTKPCDAGTIEQVIDRACALRALISDEMVHRIVGKVQHLPSVPETFVRLQAIIEDPKSGRDEVAAVLKQDVAMCAKVLQVVNSAFFRLSRTISSIDEAVVYLGLDTLKNLVLAVDVFQERPVVGINIAELQQHALATAGIAAHQFADKKESEDAFVAGMLHDIGKLVMASELPDHMQQVAEVMRAEACCMHVAEERVAGATHAEVGGYLLGLWGLPYPIIEAVANHHRPTRVPAESLDLLGAVHCANALAHEALAGPNVVEAERLDLDFVEAIGATQDLAMWRQRARERYAEMGARRHF